MSKKDTSLQSSPQLVLVEQQGVVVALSPKQVISLFKKSEQSGIPFDTLREVYQRGYTQSLSEQIAYNRVNSFISGGAAMEIDQDLIEKRGLWDNIHAKQERIKHGSGEHMRKPGSKGAPTKSALKASQVEEDAKGYKNPTGGLTQKGRDHYNREIGGHLKAPVTTPPSELKPGSKAAGRRKSFCARMSGVEGPMKKPNGEPTRKALALRKWNCEEYTGAEKVSKNSDDPSSRFVGTTSLTNVLKKETPGYTKTIKFAIKEFRDK